MPAAAIKQVLCTKLWKSVAWRRDGTLWICESRLYWMEMAEGVREQRVDQTRVWIRAICALLSKPDPDGHTCPWFYPFPTSFDQLFVMFTGISFLSDADSVLPTAQRSPQCLFCVWYQFPSIPALFQVAWPSQYCNYYWVNSTLLSNLISFSPPFLSLSLLCPPTHTLLHIFSAPY